MNSSSPRVLPVLQGHRRARAKIPHEVREHGDPPLGPGHRRQAARGRPGNEADEDAGEPDGGEVSAVTRTAPASLVTCAERPSSRQNRVGYTQWTVMTHPWGCAG